MQTGNYPPKGEGVSQALLCFGGPMNERMVEIESSTRFTVLKPTSMRYVVAETETAVFLPPPEIIEYSVQTFGYHDTRKCPFPPMGHDDNCSWSALCLGAPGYPRERITDALSAIAGMPWLLCGPPGQYRRLNRWQRLLRWLRNKLRTAPR